MTDFSNWTHAIITFHDGASYSVGGMKFVRNIPKRCPSLVVRKKLEGIKGFVIRDFYSSQNKPSEPPSAPAVKVKKKKTVKRTVKQTEGDE